MNKWILMFSVVAVGFFQSHNAQAGYRCGAEDVNGVRYWQLLDDSSRGSVAGIETNTRAECEKEKRKIIREDKVSEKNAYCVCEHARYKSGYGQLSTIELNKVYPTNDSIWPATLAKFTYGWNTREDGGQSGILGFQSSTTFSGGGFYGQRTRTFGIPYDIPNYRTYTGDYSSEDDAMSACNQRLEIAVAHRQCNPPN